MTPERTIQQLNPVGAMAGRPLAIAAACVAVLYSVVMAWVNREDISAPLLAVASLVAIAAGAIMVGLATSPTRAPLTGQTALFVVLFGTAGLVLGAASMWHTDAHVRDDWGPTAVGILLLALASYRTPRQIASLGIAVTVLAGVVGFLQFPWLAGPVPGILVVIVAAVPVAIPAVGSVVFASQVIRGIERWRRHARVAVTAIDDGDDWIARSVQQDRVTILNRDVVPFLAELLHADAVTAEDRERAREIADSIRSVMVAEADRSWLHLVIDDAANSHGPDWFSFGVVHDDDRLVQRMSIDQRSAVRAFVGALFAHPDFSRARLRMTTARADGRCTLEMLARLECADARMRSELFPYVAVMRILFPDLAVEFELSTLRLQFSYDD